MINNPVKEESHFDIIDKYGHIKQYRTKRAQWIFIFQKQSY
jgi:hypothetical protein